MRRRLEIGFLFAACVVTLVSVVRPFFVAKYPPITDLPFHAAQTSVFRHYFDPSYHFREQFELDPFGVPYLSSYVLGAMLMLVLPAVTAVKTATAIMLLAIPAGLATLAWGMRKTPLLGLAGLPFVWCNLTHWGFINFVSALGMFAAALGLALRALDRPSRRVQIALGAVLVLLFFTHVFRFPFAIAAIVGATALLYPVTKRIAPVVLPLVPSLVLFAIFVAMRPAAVGGTLGGLSPETARLDKLFEYPIGSFTDPEEPRVALYHLIVVGVIAAASFGHAYAKRRERSRREACFARLSQLVVAGCVAAFLLGYLVLPMEIGVWWYVYPREATAVLYIAMALVPDLPAERWLRGGSVALLSWSALAVTGVVSRNYAQFDASTKDFEAIVESTPKAPRLLYLVFHHGGSTRSTTPYLHLPAYVQAERGGFLSFHFAVWGSSPVRYRSSPSATVPPPVPRRWEWQPHLFEVDKHGRFFEWFLVRSAINPREVFSADPSIVEVRHEGTWWLYRREAPASRKRPVEGAVPAGADVPSPGVEGE